MNIRQTNWNIVDNKCFDIAIIGGGINGASIYRTLCQQGYKVFLIDKGNFSCGTSQASAMMIWGRNKYFVYLALQLYWILGKCKRDSQGQTLQDRQNHRTSQDAHARLRHTRHTYKSAKTDRPTQKDLLGHAIISSSDPMLTSCL